jgi:hypothetical protein
MDKARLSTPPPVSSRGYKSTHIGAQIRDLHGSVLDIVAVINRPQGDEVLIKEAAIPLDRALFSYCASAVSENFRTTRRLREVGQ